MTKKSRQEEIVDRIIESEIQQTGENILASLPEYPEIEAAPEEIQKEYEAIMKRREAYEMLTKGEVSFKKDEKMRRNSRVTSLAKVAVLVLVVGACLFGFSMRSEATRMWWLSSVEKIVGEDRREAVDNDDNRVVSATAEDDARQIILEETGIPMPGMAYRPEGLLYDAFLSDGEVHRGEMYYLYGEYAVFLYGFDSYQNMSYYNMQDGQILSEKTIKTDYGKVNLKEIHAEGDAVTSILAEWVYNNHQYQMIGKISTEEAQKIIENIFY